MAPLYTTIKLGGYDAEARALTRDFALKLIADRTPVKTGKLKSSWDVALSGDLLVVTNYQPYATYVEEGTTRMKAREMVAGAEAEIQDFYRRNASDRILAQLNNAKFNPLFLALSAAILSQSKPKDKEPASRDYFAD